MSGRKYDPPRVTNIPAPGVRPGDPEKAGSTELGKEVVRLTEHLRRILRESPDGDSFSRSVARDALRGVELVPQVESDGGFAEGARVAFEISAALVKRHDRETAARAIADHLDAVTPSGASNDGSPPGELVRRVLVRDVRAGDTVWSCSAGDFVRVGSKVGEGYFTFADGFHCGFEPDRAMLVPALDAPSIERGE